MTKLPKSVALAVKRHLAPSTSHLVSKAMAVLLAEWDEHGEGLRGQLPCYSPCGDGDMEADIDGEWIKVSDLDAVMRALAKRG